MVSLALNSGDAPTVAVVRETIDRLHAQGPDAARAPADALHWCHAPWGTDATTLSWYRRSEVLAEAAPLMTWAAVRITLGATRVKEVS